MKIIFVSLFLGIFLMGSSASWAFDDKAKIFSVKGDVKIVPSGRNIGVECVKNMEVKAGDWIKTGPSSSVSLSFDEKGDNIIRIEENSLVIMKLDGYFKIQMLAGEIYAILEDVSGGESFRVLTPSVVTESMSSGWGAKSDGTYTNVVVFENEAYICGLNKDGSSKKEKFWIDEGYQRKTINFEDPGEMEKAPEEMVKWFKKQVLSHYLEKTISDRAARSKKMNMEKAVKEIGKDKKAAKNAYMPPKDSNTIIVDGEEINLLEYLYKKRVRLQSTPESEKN